VIGIFAALGRELKPIKACLPSVDEIKESGVRFSIGRLDRLTVVLVQTGIGWNRASSAARIAADRFPLKYYVSTGFAGALQSSMRVGDLVIGQKILSLASNSPAQAPAIDPKVFVSDADFTQSAAQAAKTFPGAVFLGSFVTIGKIAGRAEEKKAIAKTSDAIALDMETSAVAGAAEHRRAPFVAVRAVSDLLEEDLGFDGGLFLTDQGACRWWPGLRHLIGHPAALSGLNRLRRQSNDAARSLGIFFQDFLPLLNRN
jgi:adenosylhomocysteine nucleosidase